MRKFASITLATAVEALDDPLSLLVLLSSASLAVLAPTLHYHQFGEYTRMARDAGLSSLFLGGVVLSLFAAVRSIRRELDSNTVEMLLSRAVPRPLFIVGKFAGVMAVHILFSFTVAAITLVMMNGAAIGGEAAARTGSMARIHGPSFLVAVTALLLPPCIAACMNRFFNSRFVLAANLLMLALSSAAVFFRPDFSMAVRFAPVAFAASLPAVFVSSVALAAAVRFKSNIAATAGFLALLAFIPFVGSYYLPESLSKGGSLGWGYALAAFVSIAPCAAAAVFAGIALFARKEV